MRVSIITAVFNCVDFIDSCIQSVLSQDYADIEYLIIDGGSTDGTLLEIEKHRLAIDHLVSGEDLGMYDALNKGIELASGECIGILNADDIFGSTDVVSCIVGQFIRSGCDAVYGNIRFTKRGDVRLVTRKWNSRQYNLSDFRFGWMPPHPTLYIRRDVLLLRGLYSLKFGSSADYEMILRLLYINQINAVFIDKVLVLMRQGGMSNGSIRKIFSGTINDYRVLTTTKVKRPLLALAVKKLRKVNQFRACKRFVG